MGHLVVVLAVVQQVLGLYYSFGFPHYQDAVPNSESVSVHDVYSTLSPVKPLDGHMPEELHFHIARKYNKGIRLRLRRWDNQEQLAPVYRLKNGSLEQMQLSDTSSSVSLYQGKHPNDIFLVQAAANYSNSNFSLRGVFWKAGKQFELTPSQVGYADVAYTVREVEQMSYADDMLYPPPVPDLHTPAASELEDGKSDVCNSSRGDGTLVPDRNINTSVTPIDVVSNATGAKRVRRQATGLHYIELAVLTDYQLYQRFLKVAKGNAGQAQSEMSQYYRYFVASMDKRYQTITDYFPKLKVRVIMTSLTICDDIAVNISIFQLIVDFLARLRSVVCHCFLSDRLTYPDPAECAWSKNNVIPSTEKIAYSNALTQFRDFVLKPTSPKGDHRMFITGYQMAKPDGTTGNIGISYVGSMCTDWSVSMIQERYSSVTSGVAAHELGHSLGSFHDDNKAYIGCSNQHYVMNSIASFPTAQNLASRPYHFSNCSANSIAEYLKGTKASCTNNQPSSPNAQTTPAGQHFNADAQCAFYNGVGSKFCRKEQKERGFQTMCTRMACSLPSNPATCTDIVPHDRTSCGDAQWCVDNICVSDASAPKTPKNCPQGDDPTAGCAVGKCNGDANSLVLCCQTCSKS